MTVQAYQLKSYIVRAIVLSPAVIVLLYSFSLAFPPTRSMASATLEGERHLVEILTFIFLLLGSVLGLALAWRIGRERRGEVLTIGFYVLFSVGLLFIAMEEVAWGQHLLGFETPSSIKEINRQDETTLHNIGPLQGRTEFFRLAFGLGGLLGVLATSRQRLQKVGAPVILLPWFLIIIALSGLDLYEDYFGIGEPLGFYVRKSSELVEMMIAISLCLYVWLNARTLTYLT
jgi:hypothetical protein